MVDSMHLDEEFCQPAQDEMPENALPLDTADPAFRDELRRIQDHRTEALENSNSLYAVVAGMNSGLMEIQLYLSGALRRVLAAAPVTIDSIQAQAGPIDLNVRLSKQILQISNLEIRMSKATGEVATLPVRPR